jgi:hypothetical protein
MPYWTSARIEIVNRAGVGCDLSYEIQYKTREKADYPKELCGYFHARFAAGQVHWSDPKNFMVLEAEGAGHVVGVIKGAPRTETWPWFLGENDEMVYMDDNLAVQSWGTGGEDYPLFCYGMRTESHPVWGGWEDWRYYRPLPHGLPAAPAAPWATI